MINYKISFLIVVISVVCFSADVDPEEVALRRTQNASRCTNALYSTFGISNSVLKCIQLAIMRMKLYGDHAFTYDDHVEMYYKLFYKSVQLDSVLLPREYCRSNQDCYNQLRIFELPPNNENILPEPPEVSSSGRGQKRRRNPQEASSSGRGQKRRRDENQNIASISQSNPNSSQNDYGISKYNINSQEGLYSWLDSQNWVQKDDQQIIEDPLEMIVLKNALYYHVIFYQKYGFEPPVDEARKYFHDARTYGFTYLSEMARCIKFKKESLASPPQFCVDVYS